MPGDGVKQGRLVAAHDPREGRFIIQGLRQDDGTLNTANRLLGERPSLLRRKMASFEAMGQLNRHNRTRDQISPSCKTEPTSVFGNAVFRTRLRRGDRSSPIWIGAGSPDCLAIQDAASTA